MKKGFTFLVAATALTLLMSIAVTSNAADIQWPVGDVTYQLKVGSQVLAEEGLTDGGLYLINQPRNNCCIEEGSDNKLMLNGLNNEALNGSTSTTYVLKFLKNTDGTWQIQTSSGRYFPVVTGNANLYSSDTAGNYTFNFTSDGYVFPRTENNGTVYGLDRASSGVYSFSTINSTVGSAQCYQIFPVELSEYKEEDGIAEFTTYEIANAYGRGKVYYSPDNSHDFLWSTGKNDSNTDADNYKWLFVKTADGDYNIYNIGRHAYIKPTSEMGSFSGQTWIFTQEKVGITLTKLTSTTYSIRTTEGNIYMSSSNGYTGPLISYYDASDQGVPYTLAKGDSVSDEVKDEILNGVSALTERDLSVKQGYHTIGRNEEKGLLLRVGIPGNIPATINKLTFSLKGKTSSYAKQISLYQTDNPEFYADDNPTLLGQTTPDGEKVEIKPIDYVLKSGANYFYLTVALKDDAQLADMVDAALVSVDYTHEGEANTIEVSSSTGDPAGEAKIYAVRSFAYVPTTDNCRHYRIPAMILDKEGNIVVASDRRYESSTDLGNHKIDVSIRRSEDGGRSWSAQNIIAVGDGKTTSDYGYGDPALARTKGGRLVCMMAAGSVMYWNGMRHAVICTSDDNGLTWTAPRQLYTSHFTDAVNNKTDELGFYGNFISSGKGLTTFDGTVMFTNNCLTYDNTSSPQCYLISSTDEGENWTIGPAKAYAGCDESKLEQLNDGRLIVSVRHSGDRGFNTGNADGTEWGTSWKNGQISGNACNADILYFSRKTEGEADIMLHSYIKSSSRENLTLAMSIDEGESWTDFMTIQPGGAAYSTMVRMADGDLAILFEDESYSVGNGYAQTFVTITKEQINAFAAELAKEDAPYLRALESLNDGDVYLIRTSYLNDVPVKGRFHLKADGTLSSESFDAKYFTFQKKAYRGGYKPYGWNIGQFTNPTNASTNSKYIRTDTQNRDDWERQVIFEDENGYYAIRATNAATEATWGSNAFWTTDSSGNATYDLAGGTHYIWEIVKVGTTPTFEDGQTYQIMTADSAYLQKSGTENTLVFATPSNALDFVIQPVSNDIGSFTIQDKSSSLYLTAEKGKPCRLSSTATPCKIQLIDTCLPYCYSILGPFSTSYQHMVPKASETEDCTYVLQCEEGINDPSLYLSIIKSADTHLKGDVNEDGKVDINDVVCVINQMAGVSTYRYADVNEDEGVDINDVVAIINIMAGK